MEFSKKALLIQYAASGLLLVTAVAGTFAGRDVSALAVLAGGSILADGTVTSFYLWKAKSENRAKYAEKFALKFAEKYGFEAALRFSEMVLRD